jgi:hypothetical protein
MTLSWREHHGATNRSPDVQTSWQAALKSSESREERAKKVCRASRFTYLARKIFPRSYFT